MHVEQYGNTIFVRNAMGWDMSEGLIALTLHEAKLLRNALDNTGLISESEGVAENGEDG